ncbi:MAG: c-type cytochrome [Anaerolineae bacterium]
MRKSILLAIALVVVGTLLLVGVVAAQGGNVSRGARLYDKWWGELGVDAPTADHLLWATQSSNTRSGKDTWRCKECHGWDYMGVDGAYGSGSHKTGFAGVYSTAQSKSVDDLVAALKGGANPDHDFSSYMDDAALTDLATFMKEGPVDDREYIDYSTKAPKNGDKEHGKQLFDGLCAACHDADGTKINFHTPEAPEYVGTVAGDNPWEFFHKVRFGQPGSDPAMPATSDLGWSVQDAVDVLAYAQTLPTGEEAPAALPTTGATQPAWAYPALLAGLLALILGLGLLVTQSLRRVQL